MTELETLLARAQAPDATLEDRQVAFSQLVIRFQDLAVGCAYARLGDLQLAEDAAQEAFLTAYHHLAQLREPAAFPRWLRRIILTHCSRLTRGKRLIVTPIERSSGLPAPHTDPAELVEQGDIAAAVRAAVLALPDRERMAVLLYYFSGYAQHELAAFLDVPLATVKKRLQYARHHLQGPLFALACETLGLQRPSTDDRFVRAIQFAVALDAMHTERQRAADAVLELDGLEATRTADGEALLVWAAELGSFDLVDLLLQDGVDVDARDAAGRTLLSCAVERGDVDLAAHLLRLGADRALEDSSGYTPVQLALAQGQPTMVALLHGRG